MPSIERSFYLLNTRTICVFFSVFESSVLMALNFYYKDTLEKVTMQKTQQFSAFVCYRKNRVKVAEHSFRARFRWCNSARA